MHTPCTQSLVPSQTSPGQADGAQSSAAIVGQVMVPSMPDSVGGATEPPPDGHASHVVWPLLLVTLTSSTPPAQRVG